jgi:hypothetical protein
MLPIPGVPFHVNTSRPSSGNFIAIGKHLEFVIDKKDTPIRSDKLRIVSLDEARLKHGKK